MISSQTHSAQKGQANDGAARRAAFGATNARQTFTPSAAPRPARPPVQGATHSPQAARVVVSSTACASFGAQAFHSNPPILTQVSGSMPGATVQLHRAGQRGAA